MTGRSCLAWPFLEDHGLAVESLYRDIRALRIYEGASYVERIAIARSLLAEQF